MAVATPKDAPAISESLGTQGSGGLALAAGPRVYAIPMSFGYHDEDPAVHLRFRCGPASQKRRFDAEADRGSGD